MGRRWERFLGEVGAYLTVGLVATIVAMLIFNLLVHGFGGPGLLNAQPIPAFLIANVVGMGISFYGSRDWAFRHRDAVGRGGGWVAFVVINVVTLGIPAVCLAISRYGLGLTDPVSDNVSANIIGLALGNAARFFALRRFVFRRPQPTAAAGEPA